MSAAARVVLAILVITVVTVLACSLFPTFPDDQLHRPHDATVDVVEEDTTPVEDTGGFDSGFEDTGSMDAAIEDSATPADAEDIATDANVCEMLPGGTVPGRRLFSLPNANVRLARDLTFTADGKLVVANLEADLLDSTGHSTLYWYPLEGATNIRFAQTGELLLNQPSVMAILNVPPMGQLVPDAGVVRVRCSPGGLPGLQPRGLAIDALNNLWFSTANTAPAESDGVYRMTVEPPGSGGCAGFERMVAAGPTVVGLRGPSHLAFTPDGSSLIIAGSTGLSVGTLYRATLVPDDGGPRPTMDPPVAFAASLGTISGLAIDRCGNIYVADQGNSDAGLPGQIWRIPVVLGDSGSRSYGVPTPFVTSIPSPSGLAFGVAGSGFDPRGLYTISTSDRAVYSVAAGVEGTPVPARP